jgi:hypothetical protein
MKALNICAFIPRGIVKVFRRAGSSSVGHSIRTTECGYYLAELVDVMISDVCLSFRRSKNIRKRRIDLAIVDVDRAKGSSHPKWLTHGSSALIS